MGPGEEDSSASFEAEGAEVEEGEDGLGEMTAVIEAGTETSTFETDTETREAGNASESGNGVTQEIFACADHRSEEHDRRREIFENASGIYLWDSMPKDRDVVLAMAGLPQLARQRRSLCSASHRFPEAEDLFAAGAEADEAIGPWKGVEDESPTTIVVTATLAVDLRKVAGRVSGKSASAVIDIQRPTFVAIRAMRGTEESVNSSVPRWKREPPRNRLRKSRTLRLLL